MSCCQHTVFEAVVVVSSMLGSMGLAPLRFAARVGGCPKKGEPRQSIISSFSFIPVALSEVPSVVWALIGIWYIVGI